MTRALTRRLPQGGRIDRKRPIAFTLDGQRLEGFAGDTLASALMAVNSLAAPLLTAGFYYKTFMGPRRGSWMFYEPFIRRAAGLGAGTYESDPDRYETRHEFADVLVVGSGPAGLAAPLAAGRSGARVVLVEQDSLAGGSLLSEPLDGH